MEAGRYFIRRAMQYTWWGWEEGSRCFFWRWLIEFKQEIIYGQKQWQVETWQRFFMPQREGKYAQTSGKEARKLNKAREKGYIITG